MVERKLIRAFLDYLQKRDILGHEDVNQALNRQRELTCPLGRLALQTRTLTVREVNVTVASQLDTKLHFGAQAIELGYMSHSDLDFLLDLQDQNRPKLCKVLMELEMVEPGVMERLREDFLEAAAAALV